MNVECSTLCHDHSIPKTARMAADERLRTESAGQRGGGLTRTDPNGDGCGMNVGMRSQPARDNLAGLREPRAGGPSESRVSHRLSENRSLRRLAATLDAGRSPVRLLRAARPSLE